jgi:serine/threonine protein kinase
MTEMLRCPECGADLGSDSPDGLCPQCLLKRGLGNSSLASALRETPTGPHVPFAAPAPAELVGLFPHLEVLEFLGQGGMGAVYKARQVKLDRLVALKVLPPEWGKDPAFAERFAREARALAKLSHPQIVAVHDFGEANGLFYLVMEYVDGANLRQHLAAGKLPSEEALRLVPQVCEALQYAHEEGVVHRDIKPENILLDRKGRVKIADFGLAKLLGRPRATFTLTGSQQVMGTLDYMAPEQRERPQEVDHRADIYSLGVVLYEMLTGQLPLGRFVPPSQKSGVDARLDAVVFRALEQEPERRYQHVREFKTDLEGVKQTGAPERSTEAGPVRGRVRSFLRSLRSLFFSSPVGEVSLAGRPANAQEQQAAIVAGPERRDQPAPPPTTVLTPVLLPLASLPPTPPPRPGRPPRLLTSVTALAFLACFAGVGAVFLPWVDMSISETPASPPFMRIKSWDGLSVPHGTAVLCVLGFLFCYLIATGGFPQVARRRVRAFILAAIGVILVAVLFIYGLGPPGWQLKEAVVTRLAEDVDLLRNADYLRELITTRGKHGLAEVIKVAPLKGPYVTMAVAAVLLVLAMVEIRGILTQASRPPD